MNDFGLLDSSSPHTASDGCIQKSLDEFDSPRSQSFNDSDFEMPPQFPPGATVGDLASHISRVISNSSPTRISLNAVDENGFAPEGKEFTDSGKSDLPHSRVALAGADRPLDAPFQKADRLEDTRMKAPSSSNLLKPPEPTESEPNILETPSIISDCSKSPNESSGFVDNLQNTNIIPSENVADDDWTDFAVHDRILNDPEFYSNSSGENNDFDDFAAFQSAETEKVFSAEFDPSQNAFKEIADLPDFRNPNYPNKSTLPTCSLVKNLLIHAQTALEAAFSIDMEAGLNTFVPSELLSPSALSTFRTCLLDLWERASSETVQNLLSSVSAHPESFASRRVWNSSHTYSMFLGTIGVDLQSTRFVLPNHGRLKLLEPTPIGSHTVALANPSPTHLPPSTNDAAATDPASQIPVPEFDWSASGLTNPLSIESVTQSASDADLELFEEMPFVATSKPPAPISDLEAEFLHSVPPPPETPPTQRLPPTLYPLDVYVDKPKTAAAANEPEIPECVSKVLELLPDFSYLRKSILAFPVLDQTD